MQFKGLLAAVFGLLLLSCEEGQKATEEKLAPSSVATLNDEGVKTVSGMVLAVEPHKNLEDELWIHFQDEKETDFYFIFKKEENKAQFDAFPKTPARMQVFYKTNKQQVALDVQPLGMIGGKAKREYGMRVYTVKGKQKNIKANEFGLIISIETEKGTTLEYLADYEVYLGAKPEEYNGKVVQIVYTEEEELLMTGFQSLSNE